MKTKIPKKINILGHEYSIKIVKEIKSGTTGIMQYPQRIILIHKSLSPEIKWLTFLHEVMHAYHYESGLTQIYGSQLSETNCESMASFISSLQKQGIL